VKLIRIIINVAVLGIFLLTLLIGLNRNNVKAEDKIEITAARRVTSPNVFLIVLEHDHLTVKVQDILLKELLEEIARLGDLTLMVNTSLKERVTLEFYGQPLEAGLRRILRSHSYALEYGKKRLEKSQALVPVPRKLWIFSNGGGKSPEQMVGKRKKGYSQPVVVAEPAWQDAMTSKDPEERRQAYEDIVKSLPDEDPEVLEKVEESLREFEKAMTEQELEQKDKTTRGSEIMEKTETP